MKQIHFLIIIAILSLVACNKEVINNGSDLKPLQPSQIDENAGTWKNAVLTSSTQISIPAPSEVSSSEYQAELTAIKDKMANLSDEEREIINYWSAGSVLRWNQIMRNLVAKYNLPPASNDDGTYTFPNADSTLNNPLYYPAFPFANPPYAARAYAYVSVAQYDAAVAANAYRKQYARPMPYITDASIEPLVPITSLSSYPCEDAVIASATFMMLKALFPGEIGYLTTQANNAKWYQHWAGAATSSDVVAGDSLGKNIALVVLGRAKTDGAKFAIGNQGIWDSLSNAATARGISPWKSLETPVRPPMLPLFGQLKTWLMDRPTLESIRPAAPPAVSSTELQTQLAELHEYTDKPSRENISIVHFWGDGAGTYTPPGHWNAIACDALYEAQHSQVRMARNLALLNMTLMDAAISCWDTKNFYFYPRPSQVDPTIKTLTGVPNFPAYTSGHSTFSAAAARILGHIFPANAASYKSMAKEASESRILGGIHYRMDCEQGLICGEKIGEFAIVRATSDGAE